MDSGTWLWWCCCVQAKPASASVDDVVNIDECATASVQETGSERMKTSGMQQVLSTQVPTVHGEADSEHLPWDPRLQPPKKPATDMVDPAAECKVRNRTIPHIMATPAAASHLLNAAPESLDRMRLANAGMAQAKARRSHQGPLMVHTHFQDMGASCADGQGSSSGDRSTSGCSAHSDGAYHGDTRHAAHPSLDLNITSHGGVETSAAALPDELP